MKNITIIASVLVCLVYFFFSVEHTGASRMVCSRIGIWVLMITFGASFGYTVMGRIALLAEPISNSSSTTGCGSSIRSAVTPSVSRRDLTHHEVSESWLSTSPVPPESACGPSPFDSDHFNSGGVTIVVSITITTVAE